jgi:carboxyl-terminal processing protease
MYGYAAGDEYSSYYTAEEWLRSQSASRGNAKGIGVYVVMNEDGNILVARVMKNSPAFVAGLKDGDIITAVDGKKVTEVGYDAAVDLVLGEEGTIVSFDVLRGTETWEIDVTRGSYDPQTVFAETVTVENNLYGYIHIVQFEGTTPRQFIAAADELIKAGVKGFIFDVRDNPGGDLWAIIEILDYLLPKGPIVHIVGKAENDVETYSSNENEIDLPMVVLANENTASAAELFTSALKDYDKAEIVGKKTFGKGCGQTGQFLSDGSVIFITTFLYNPPFSENYDGVGIHPDYEIDLGREWKNVSLFIVPHEEDAPLAKAIDVLHEIVK